MATSNFTPLLNPPRILTPTPPRLPTTPPSGGGGTYTPSGLLPIQTYTNMPAWYKDLGLTASTNSLSFARLANAMLPFFSAQDQQSVAVFLNAQDPKNIFKDYSGNIPSQGAETATEETRPRFLSSERARAAISYLESLRQKSKLTAEQMGPGYKFIMQALGILQGLGANATAGEQNMTRAEYESLQSQLAALNSQAQNDRTLAPYAELATKFINPTLINELNPTTVVGSSTVYGKASKKLFV